MRILRAEISGFGHYRDRVFDFQAANQLIYGRNETGKSTLYQFILAVLFGFPSKGSKKKDYTPQNGAAYGGRLFLQIGPYDEVVVERFRNVRRAKAVVYIEGIEKEEQVLIDLLRPLTKATFCNVFTFQQEQLSQIDQLQEEELHASLISLGISGSQQLMDKICSYQKENQQLFKARARKLRLNQQISQWKALKKVIDEQEEQEFSVQQAYQQISAYDQSSKVLTEKLEDLQRIEKQLAQQKSHWSLYEEWQQLGSVESAQRSATEQEELQIFYHAYQNVTEEIRKKEEELARLEKGQESDRYFFYLDHENEIQQLLKMQTSLTRIQEQEKQLASEQGRLTDLFDQYEKTWGWTLYKQPQNLGEEVVQSVDQLEILEKQEEQKKAQVHWLIQHRQNVEQEIDQLEADSPGLLVHSRKPSVAEKACWFIAAITLVLGFFGQGVLRYAAWLIAAICLGYNLWQLTGKKPLEKNKLLWQEKLVQLDDYSAEVQKEEKYLAEIISQKQERLHFLQPILGTYKNLTYWREMCADYQKDQQNFAQTIQQQQSLQEEQRLMEEKRKKLAENFAFLSDWLPLANKNIEEKYVLTEKFAQEMQAVKLTRLQQPATLLAQQLKQSKQDRSELFEQYAALLAEFGIEQVSEIPVWFKHWEKLQRQLERKKELQVMLEPVFPQAISAAEWDEQMKENQKQQQQLQMKLRQTTEEKQRLQLEVEYLQKNGRLDELYQEESRMRSEIQTTALQWSTNQLLIQFLNDLATDLSEQQLPQLLDRASYYFALLTQKRYQKIELAAGVLQVKTETESFSIYDLSTGTKDQLIMALRFGYLYMQRKRQLAPIIIDDGWLHYDSRRKQTLAELLAEFSQYYQLICLSSDKEMVSYYQKLDQRVENI